MITLVIKGPKHEAVAAVRERGIDATFFPSRNRLFVGDVTLLRMETDNHFHDAIAKWYNEKTSIIRGFGYPIGTLLHYQYED